MKAFLLVFVINAMAISNLYGQCTCYSVEAIHLLSDSIKVENEKDLRNSDNRGSGINFTLKNTCDNKVYLKLFMISNANDTIAWTDFWSIFVLPLNTSVTWTISTNLKELPPAGTYRIAITNQNLVCNSIEISPLLTGINKEALEKDREIRLFPNPIINSLNLEAEEEISSISLLDQNGVTLIAKDNLEGNFFKMNVEQLLKGTYTIIITDKFGKRLIKKIIK